MLQAEKAAALKEWLVSAEVLIAEEKKRFAGVQEKIAQRYAEKIAALEKQRELELQRSGGDDLHASQRAIARVQERLAEAEHLARLLQASPLPSAPPQDAGAAPPPYSS
mmetsp:Transcript_22873/g.59699  ORF Transcript_22873/g.59699 Transcript_22873/m.59699 type:complete len:109 (-) Transcript_22873:245-571(-)